MSTVTHQTAAREESHTPVRGLGWYGMVFFIASEAVFFANLIAAYLYLHVHAGPHWPTLDLDKVLAAVNTVILVSSSFVLTFAARALNRGNRRAFSGLLLLTILMGATFISIQLYEYVNNGFGPDKNIFASSFYTLTGFHGAHVTVGILFLTVCWFRSLRGDFSKDNHFALTAAEMDWHFVDVVWIFLVLLLYFVVR